ncbi:MAG: 50S ribosomal protein L24 [Bacteroidales bacterium]|nr:50S ribosomal protein L24 [Bacteroidales bacterium]
MKKFKIKKGDIVRVNSGNDKGKIGKVLSILTDKDRVIVEGVNLVSKHTKPNSKQPQGGIVKQEAAIHISNVNLTDPTVTDKDGKKVGTRVGYKTVGDKKVRVAKKSGQEVK